MSGRNLNLDLSQEWQDNADEDYVNRIDIDKEISSANNQGKKSDARLRIEELKERKQLDELLYDPFQDSDSIM